MSYLKTRIVKNGNSTAIRLTQAILQEAELSLGDEVLVEVDKDNRLVIIKKENDFKNQIRDFYRKGGLYQEEMVDFGDSVGAEW